METKTLNLGYNREEVKSGILHFGVGNFHRAHLQFYTNQLLSDKSQQEWGICGAMIMPQDEKLFNALKEQDGVYSVTVCGRDDKNTTEWIGSLVELLWSGENSEEIINKVADKDIKIITLTITEGGYNTDKSTGEFVFDNPQIVHDLNNPQSPKGIFGFVAEGLRRRRSAGNGAVTILSCDNLQHNGNTCKRVFTAFIEKQDAELAAWVKENVSFPNSMVDRITPATTPADVERLNQTLSTYDAAPVYCEDFIQWVVEDNFIAGRPTWENVGVQFTEDVTPYETMKLSLLNASHTLLSYPSLLSGYRKVDEAMHDERIVKFVRDFMDKDVTPYVPAPKGIDLEEYKQILVERFANKSVSDQIGRLCGDGASKFPVYVMPIAAQMVANGDDMTRVAFLIAAYRHYLKYQVDDLNVSYEIFDPWLTESDMAVIASDNAGDFVSASPFSSVNLASDVDFSDKYAIFTEQIKEIGTMKVLESIIL